MNKRITSLLLITAILISGCNTNVTNSDQIESHSSDMTFITAVSEPETTTTETEKQLFEYNPHPYVSFLSGEIPQDYWDSFNNLSDALRKGDDGGPVLLYDAQIQADGAHVELRPGEALIQLQRLHQQQGVLASGDADTHLVAVFEQMIPLVRPPDAAQYPFHRNRLSFWIHKVYTFQVRL